MRQYIQYPSHYINLTLESRPSHIKKAEMPFQTIQMEHPSISISIPLSLTAKGPSRVFPQAVSLSALG
jgi:hypothetical protein